jgi:hypothetical protein
LPNGGLYLRRRSFMTLDQHPNEMYKNKNKMYNYSGGRP